MSVRTSADPLGARTASGSLRLPVLLAEEEESWRLELAYALRLQGLTVIDVEDGAELLDHLEEAYSERPRVLRPGLVVSEVLLPGYTGIQACQRLRQYDPEAPVLLLHWAWTPKTRHLALEAGATRLLPLPQELSHLVRVCEGMLDAWAPEAPCEGAPEAQSPSATSRKASRSGSQ